MPSLPLANILHYKLRSVLSSLAIALGVCMLVTLGGLSRGSLREVADRWESVNADMIVYPSTWGENISTMSGIGLSDRFGEKMKTDNPQIVAEVIPVFLWQVRFGKQDQMTAGVDPDQWEYLTGGRKLSEGKKFDPDGKFANWLTNKLSQKTDDDRAIEITEADLSAPDHNGLEVIIDSRLAKSEKYKVGQVVHAANHNWKIVGIVPEGAMTRVFMPRRTAQFLFGSASINKSTLFFVKLRPGVDPDDAAKKLRSPMMEVIPLSQYRAMLERKWGLLYGYVDAVNAIALTIAFMFIMVTLYMMVLQRTREIAILKSCGASRAYIIRQIMAESATLTFAGTVIGISLSFAAAWAIEIFKPLLTVRITWHWILLAVVVAAVGAAVSALYPAWRATKIDMVEALSYE